MLRTFEICSLSLLVSKGGGTVDYVTDEGEVLMSVDVPPGMVSAREYLAICPPGAQMQVRDGLVAVPPRNGYGVQSYGAGSHDSGANPDYQPTSASTMERQMRAQLMRMQAATDRLEKRANALNKIETIPRNLDPDPVIEGEQDEKPKAKKAKAKPAPQPEPDEGDGE
jgi:hypothetical protein